jgi:ABC-type antimicrobial peptide transport system permease subunit
MGVRGQKIFTAFLSRAALAGFVGALAGLLVFAIVYPMVAQKFFHGESLAGLMTPLGWLVPLIATPLLAVAAAWLPAMLAAQKDPADVLRQD